MSGLVKYALHFLVRYDFFDCNPLRLCYGGQMLRRPIGFFLILLSLSMIAISHYGLVQFEKENLLDDNKLPGNNTSGEKLANDNDINSYNKNIESVLKQT